MTSTKNSIEVCFVPELFKSKQTTGDCITVVVDVFRASTTICSALNEGVEEIIPAGTLTEAEVFKSRGYIIAGERDGKKLDIATYGNSPFDFNSKKNPKQIVLSTSNGTVAINTARESSEVVIGAFCNLSILSSWISKQNKPVVILCSGWLGSFSMEDSLFAGALVESLMVSGEFSCDFDSSVAALNLWKDSKDNLLESAKEFTHYKRLVKLGAEEDAKFALKKDSLNVIPYLNENYLININPSEQFL